MTVSKSRGASLIQQVVAGSEKLFDSGVPDPFQRHFLADSGGEASPDKDVFQQFEFEPVGPGELPVEQSHGVG